MKKNNKKTKLPMLNILKNRIENVKIFEYGIDLLWFYENYYQYVFPTDFYALYFNNTKEELMIHANNLNLKEYKMFCANYKKYKKITYDYLTIKKSVLSLLNDKFVTNDIVNLFYSYEESYDIINMILPGKEELEVFEYYVVEMYDINILELIESHSKYVLTDPNNLNIIQYYTSNIGYTAINKYLSSNKLSEKFRLGKTSMNMISSLYNLIYNHDIDNGIPYIFIYRIVEYFENIPEFEINTFWSCSRAFNLHKEKNYNYRKKTLLKICIHKKFRKFLCLEKLSLFPDELEILLPPGTVLKTNFNFENEFVNVYELEVTEQNKFHLPNNRFLLHEFNEMNHDLYKYINQDILIFSHEFHVSLMGTDIVLLTLYDEIDFSIKYQIEIYNSSFIRVNYQLYTNIYEEQYNCFKILSQNYGHQDIIGVHQNILKYIATIKNIHTIEIYSGRKDNYSLDFYDKCRGEKEIVDVYVNSRFIPVELFHNILYFQVNDRLLKDIFIEKKDANLVNQIVAINFQVYNFLDYYVKK